VLLDGSMDFMHTENQRVLNLVPDSLLTEQSLKSGNWDDPTIWSLGRAPQDGDNVLVSYKTTVTITADEAITAGKDPSGNPIVSRRAVNMLRVDGTLQFDASPAGNDTAGIYHPPLRRLLVDTIVVSPVNFMVTVKNPDGTTTTQPFYNNDDILAMPGDDPSMLHAGTFQMGTMSQPIDPTAKAEVVFADNGPVGNQDFQHPDHEVLANNPDPYELSRGLVAMGSVSIFGSQVTSFEPVAPNLSTGETLLGPTPRTQTTPQQITLSAAPTGWQIGDRLVITGDTASNGAGANQDEQVGLKGLTKNADGTVTITIDQPLKFAHYAPSSATTAADAAKPAVYVADVSRNAVFRSENVGTPAHPGPVADRGHIMFMHTLDVQIEAAGFYGLGRTDKRNPIDDPNPVQDYDNNGNPIPGQVTDDVLDTKNPALKSQGYRVMVPVYDANGNPVPVLGPDGKPLHNPDGSPVYQMQIARSGLDPRGRYAVHFHHDKADMVMMMPGMPMPAMGPATIDDSAVVDSPGWGIVNHSSDVDVTNNVVFNALGAAYVTEAGDEIGSFVGNLAIHAQGSGAGIESRQQFQDFGHQGDGFWFQGGNVTVVNNIATGMRHSGFVFFPVGLEQKGLPKVTIPVADIMDEPWAPMDPKITSVAVGDVPLRKFSGNVAYGDGDGFESWFSLLSIKPTDARRDTLTNFTVFATGGTGIFTPYSNLVTFDHVRVLGNVKSFNPGGTGFARNDVTANVTYNAVDVEGFNTGINAPVNGNNSILGGTFENLNNIYITTAASRDRVVNIDDYKDATGTTVPITFVPVPIDKSPTAKPPPPQFDINLQSNFNPKEHDITTLFNRDVIRLGTVKIHGQQVYYLEQALDFVPFPSATAEKYIPTALLDQTNAQMSSTYGLAIAGIVAPVTAAAGHVDRVHGIVGPAASYPADMYLLSHKYSQFPDATHPSYAPYYLQYKYADPSSATGYTTMKETTPTALLPGWNLISRTIAGATRTLLVYGDNIPPDFVPDAKQGWLINKADFDNNAIWVLTGEITDDSFGQRFFRHNFTLGDTHFFSPLHASTDQLGNPIVVTTFTMTVVDYAGNKTVWSHDLVVTLDAPLQKDLGRKFLPDITPSETIILLIDSDPSIPKKKT
jgi:hypothetical protein